MKKSTLLLIVFLSFLSCTEPFTEFPEEALNDTMLTLSGEAIQFKDILKEYEGKQVVIDAWATWCGDCIRNLPKVKALQGEYPETVFVFLSSDRSLENLKRGIKKYNLAGEHYLMPKGMKSKFGKSIGLSWIPRYMVVDSQGKIKLFKSVKADDIKIKKALQ